MVDTQLENATGDLIGLVENFDIVSLVEGVTGLGIGLFSAEFASSFVADLMPSSGSTVTFITDLITKGLVTGGFSFAYSMVSSPLIAVLLGMAAVGSATSIVLQVIDAVASTGANFVTGQGVSGGAPAQAQSMGGQNASVEDNSFGGGLISRAARAAN